MSRISPKRVRIPTDRNVNAAARRTALVTDDLLIRAYSGKVPDLVQFVAPDMYRSFFRLESGLYACFILHRNFRNGVRLPVLGEDMALRTPDEIVNGMESSGMATVLDVVRTNPSMRVSILRLSGLE